LVIIDHQPSAVFYHGNVDLCETLSSFFEFEALNFMQLSIAVAQVLCPVFGMKG